ncbi:MAG TPA: helix-hairpin-helix domain-containing protein [Saprospiraceae bacterium]|nr:helix-hairpin-helix domain-containing protein [Saprospiraceae bacterium]HMP12767.1 helix-hairpin-helix domain-containing protein [Saprospiraceae bacterium]
MQKYSVILFLFPLYLAAQQPDTLRVEPPDIVQEIVEDFLQNTDSEGIFDFNTLFEQLEDFRRNPLNINRASENMLRDLKLLNDLQILALIRYRAEAGELISIYELQAVPSFDLATIRRILPYVTVSGEVDDYRIPVLQMLSEGNNELYLRWSRILEQQRGYTPSPTGASRYLGDPNQVYVRFRHSYGTRLSYGFTAEKDRGEEFFRGSNPQGFDFYSAHIFIRDYNKRIKALALGDYAVSLGQGLILYTGFGIGKSSSPMTIKRTGRTIRPYTSANEVNFMRGAAATLALSEHIEATLFVSNRGRSGNVLELDTLDADIEVLNFTSLDESGLHRTPTEISRKNAIQQFSTGGSLRLKNNKGHIALNALFDRFDKNLVRNVLPYSQFYFSGQQLFNTSLDYSWIWRNFNFFGETARSDNGAVATTNGLLLALDRRVDVAILQRRFPRNYQALNPNPFAETTGARNEQGLYLGLEMRPIRNWMLSAYFDVWRHPWLRFDAAAPSRGHEYRLRLSYEKRRRLRTYMEIRDEIKERNAPNTGQDVLRQLANLRTFQTRLHVENQLSRTVELRSRLDWGFSQVGDNPKSTGFAVYQDVIFRPVGFPLSFNARFAIFETEGFQTRFYSFENDLLFNFSIPAYYNRGTRFYLNARYRATRNLTLEARIAQTYWANRETIGSGLEEINGPARTQASAQVRLRF